jgi:CRISP-associated protein Cas1
MSTLYLCDQGTVVVKRSRRLQVLKEKELLLDLPVTRVDKIFLFGNIQLTTQALGLLLDQGIDVSFFTSRGRLRGRLSSGISKNIFLRLAQYERWRDQTYKIGICRSIIDSKLTNMKNLLQLYRSNYPNEDFAQQVETIAGCLNQLNEKNEIKNLLGLEGAASGAYFSAFGRMFRKELRFEKRLKHPSPDPVNALLSLGYVMITNELASLLEAAAFDPFLGFLHGVKYGRKSLALDLVEQFRQPVIDRFVLRLANLNIFAEKDFQVIPGEGMHLTDEKFKLYLDHYEKKINLEKISLGADELSWRNLFQQQVYMLEKSMMENKDYQPYILA